MPDRLGFATILAFVALFFPACAPADPPSEPQPNLAAPTLPPLDADVDLVLLIVVDQLPTARWEALMPRFGPDGFRRIADRGRYFANAGFDHGTTFTAIGHAAIVTGVLPAKHGIVANEWHERDTGKRTYSVGDRERPSPSTLLYPTVGDRLIEATGGGANVWAVSLKDRSAILMAGQFGAAVWWDKERGRLNARAASNGKLPSWLVPALSASAYNDLLDYEWDLLNPPETYEGSVEPSSFPKRIPNRRSRLGRSIRATPQADRIVQDVVLNLMREEQLGTNPGGHPDLLAIGYSATDYVGHLYGPDSVEYEDQLLRLDRAIAELLSEIDRRVGLDRTWIGLTSDHGTDSATEHRRKSGQPTGRLLGAEFVPRLNRELREDLGVRVDLVESFFPPGVFMSRRALQRSGVTLEKATAAAAERLMRRPEMEAVYVSTPYGPVSFDGKERSFDRDIAAGFYYPRSGDLILVAKPHIYVGRDGGDAAMHGTPHRYDTEVPIVVYGPGAVPGVDRTRVTPRQIAATISRILGLPPDSHAAEELPGSS